MDKGIMLKWLKKKLAPKRQFHDKIKVHCTNSGAQYVEVRDVIPELIKELDKRIAKQ